MLLAALVYKQKDDLSQAVVIGNLFPMGRCLLNTYYVLGVWHHRGDKELPVLGVTMGDTDKHNTRE